MAGGVGVHKVVLRGGQVYCKVILDTHSKGSLRVFLKLVHISVLMLL